ncbi:MAG: hypothetical protein L0Y56_16585 [Nitrospira sp.]|nr:hypothetical protein [Nitrospira sp.]
MPRSKRTQATRRARAIRKARLKARLAADLHEAMEPTYRGEARVAGHAKWNTSESKRKAPNWAGPGQLRPRLYRVPS